MTASARPGCISLPFVYLNINDNKYTIPVTGLLLSVGVPIETVVYFLSQPSIKQLIKVIAECNLIEQCNQKDTQSCPHIRF